MAKSTVTFVVPGQVRDLSRTRSARGTDVTRRVDLPGGRVTQSVQLGRARGAGGAEDVKAVATPGEDVVQLHLSGGPTLTLHPETARELFEAQHVQGDLNRGATATGETFVPQQLQWRGLDATGTKRGPAVPASVLLDGLDIISGVTVEKVANLAASAVVKRCDGQVNEGVYALSPDTLTPLKERPIATMPGTAGAGDPLLVLIHGTFSTTAGTFGKFWSEQQPLLRGVFKRYADRVYTLEHRTLAPNPIENALTLVRALPANATVHLLTHSRGGLVAEALARACAGLDEDLSPFAGAAHAGARTALKALIAESRKKKINVARIVRVACPARGTLLASNRLDAYLSVFKWTLELAGVPVAPVLVEFLAAVAKHRADPTQLGGLAAQMPDSPLIQWLHKAPAPIAGELRVVAGDVAADSLSSWLKTLVSDAYYWTDNDFVVQTRSMYGGSPRARAAEFVLDQGGKVSHFGYFAHARTADAIARALIDDAPRDFRPIGPLSLAGKASDGLRGAGPALNLRPAPEKPAVFVIPGIAGSNLDVDHERVWVSWRLAGHLESLTYSPGQNDVTEAGPIDQYYEKLASFLEGTHDVIRFGYDWRRPLEDEAKVLAERIEAALDARKTTKTPVRILAHSMGGILTRVVHLNHPKTWARLMAHKDARFVMLGTPNGGSWAPMQVASGDDRFGFVISTFGAPFKGEKARGILANLPGLVQLQAGLLDPQLKLGSAAEWAKLAREDFARADAQSIWHKLKLQRDDQVWGLPTQATLDRAVALRKKLDGQLKADATLISEKVLLVVGASEFTPDGFTFGPEGLLYVNAVEEGDGRVTLESARLPGVRTWKQPVAHGSLPASRDAFDAYLDLLRDGGTARLAGVSTASRSRRTAVDATPSATRATRRPSRSVESVTLPSTGEVFGRDDAPGPPPEPGTALRISVVNGDVRFVRQPLILGHYRSSMLTGTEGVMNGLLQQAMQDALDIGAYADAAGSQKLFLNARSPNPWQLPRPAAVIVAGLGDEGRLRASDLVQTVRQAVLAWAQRCGDASDPPTSIEMAATLLGSGGIGVTATEAAVLIAEGVRQANDRLGDPTSSGRRWPLVGHLHIIELYLDRATEAWLALRAQADATPGRFIVDDAVQPGTQAFERMPNAGYRGAAYDYIRAETQRGPQRGEGTIALTLDTKRARSEINEQVTQKALVREIVRRASDDPRADAVVGQTLFQLLVPPGLESLFGGSTAMVLELDKGTAGIPWEVLDNAPADAREIEPWAIRSQLLRKFRTVDFRPNPIDASVDAHVLVIGEPKVDTAVYPRLPGARDEARAVATTLRGESADLTGVKVDDRLICSEDPGDEGADALAVTNALLRQPWRVVHIAGHGEPPEKGKRGRPRGVVLSKGFLGPREIATMRQVPELVFINCCYSGARRIEEVLSPDRVGFAAGVAEQLINIGVRCVVATGWAVADDAAMAFATTFYRNLCDGLPFVDAVTAARKAARAFGGNTWAAYQCYGDRDWKFRRRGGDAQGASGVPAVNRGFSVIASATGLRGVLDDIAVKCRTADSRRREAFKSDLGHLEALFAAKWGSRGDVAEAFGRAWAALEPAKAIEWYGLAQAANDGTATLKATEQLGNLRVRTAKTAEDIRAGLALLQKVAAIAPTVERLSLCGSAYKRLAMDAAGRGDEAACLRAIDEMKAHYLAAEQLARKTKDKDLFYPAMQRIAAELALTAGRRTKPLDAKAVALVRDSMQARVATEPDFWSVVGLTELAMFEAAGDGSLSKHVAQIKDGFADVHSRVSSEKEWGSVYDNARFIFQTFPKRATPERKAVDDLLKVLAAYAGKTHPKGKK